MKYVLIVLVNIGVAGILSAQRITTHEVKVLSSEITIAGETNVNKFDCELFIPSISNTLTVTSKRSTLSISFDSLILSYKVRDFDCGIFAMTEDFRSILNASDYPNLLLQIRQININPDSEGFDRLAVTADVAVTIAGVSRDFLIFDSYVINETEEDLTLYGTQSVKMTDFNIDPPVRFWGAVRVSDALKINFKIRMYAESK